MKKVVTVLMLMVLLCALLAVPANAARDPMAELDHPNTLENDIQKLNEGIALLHRKNFITTFNHPRWSGVSAADMAAIQGFSNMEVVNGYEMMMDGYGDSSAFFEAELRAGRRIRPVGGDDSHKQFPSGSPTPEYFRGFTMIKAPALTYGALIDALDRGSFYASTGPVIENLWLEGGMLHLECSPVRGVYVHGHLYSHRASHVTETDTVTALDLDVRKLCKDASYLFVKVMNTLGECAWAPPLWLK